MRYAIIIDGTVDNIIELDDGANWTAPEGSTLILLDETPAGPGWTYDGTTFTAPPQIDPDA